MLGSQNEGVALVAFELAERACGLPLEQVVEVLPMVSLTPIPEAPPWLAGMLNLRGDMVPVVHMRQRLSQPPLEPGLDTPIVVGELDGLRLALIVDRLIGLLELPEEAVRVLPDWVGTGRPVRAIGRAGERVVLILDLGRLATGAHRLSRSALSNGNGAQHLASARGT